MEKQASTAAGQGGEEPLSPGAEQDSGTGEGISAAAGRRGLRRIEYLILGLVVLLVTVLVGGGVFIWARYTRAPKAQAHSVTAPETAVVELEPFFVPLKSQDEPEKFLLVTPALEVIDAAYARSISKKMEQVRTVMLQIFLGALPTELDYPQGNKELIDTMVSSLNRCLQADVVTGIRFNHAAVI